MQIIFNNLPVELNEERTLEDLILKIQREQPMFGEKDRCLSIYNGVVCIENRRSEIILRNGDRVDYVLWPEGG